MPDGEELRWWNQALLGGAQWQDTGQWAQVEIQETPLQKKNCTVRVTEPWDRLPRETVESPSSEILKTQVDAVLSDLLWLTSPWRGGWMSQSPEVPSSLIHSLTLGLLSLKTGQEVRVWGCWERAEALRAQYRTNTNKGERSSWSSLSTLAVRTYTED